MGDFVWSDAWLLLSLIYGQGPIDRQRIREIGDGINYAIFTDAELTGGFRRLRNAGLVRCVGKKYAASAKVLRWFAKAKGKARTSMREDLERVEEWLEARN